MTPNPQPHMVREGMCFGKRIALEFMGLIQDRSRRPAGAQEYGEGVEAQLQRESVGGEPQWIDRGCRSLPSEPDSGTRCGAVHDGAAPGTHVLTVGGDKGFDRRGFVSECRLILADTSVWIDHFRSGNKDLQKALNQGKL